MKKLFFIALFSILGLKSFSQQLTINNFNQVCSLYVALHAVDQDPLWGNTFGCDIYTNTILLPPATVLTWANISAFRIDPNAGYSFFATPVGGAYFSTTTTYKWTDVTYQWECKIPCIGNGGGHMSDPIATPTCYPFSSNTSGTCTTGGTWFNLTGLGVMDDVRLDFN
jgi:hypothetical protein